MPVYPIRFCGILYKTKAFLNDCNDDMHIALEIKNEGKIQTYIDLKPCVYHLIWFITSNQRLFSWQAIPQYNVGEHEISI